MLEARHLYLQVVRRWSEVYDDTIGVDEMRRIVIDIQRELQARELRAIFATWSPERLTAAIRDLEGWDGDPRNVESVAEVVARSTGKESEAQKVRETSAKRVEDIISSAMAHRTQGRPKGSFSKVRELVDDTGSEKRGRGRPKGSLSRPKEVIEAERADRGEKIFRVAKPLDPAKAAWMRDEPAED